MQKEVNRRTFIAATASIGALASSTHAAAAAIAPSIDRFISFRRPDGTPSFGRLADETVLDLGALKGVAWLKDAIDGDLAARPVTASYDRDAVKLLPVIPNPEKIICIGLNYATHVAETGREQKEFPAIFTRFANTLVADGEALVRPRETERFDYEGELAVVIGRGGRRISRAVAMAHVGGFSVFNDASVRDWQRHNSQFTPGKNFPATGGFGPSLVLPSQVPDFTEQRVQTRLNGTLVQDQPVSDLIWDVSFLIEYCSTFTELLPGDVIVSGTPGGVGDRRVPPLYMKPGDTIEVSIGSIGRLRNSIAAEE